jgi:4'-phosphopantetheinyl transferase
MARTVNDGDRGQGTRLHAPGATVAVEAEATDLDPHWLLAGEVVVEWFSLRPSSGDELLLSDDERARRDRIVIDAKRDQLVAARATLRRRLGQIAAVAPTAVEFEYSVDGRPGVRGGLCLPGGGEIDFNLSHSGAWGVVAFASDTRVGVDVEQRRLGRDFRGIIERFYSPEELAMMTSMDDEVLPEVFYRAWAQKEAYLKAWGTGLRFPSSAFTVELDLGKQPRVVATSMPDDDPARWILVDLPGPPGYATSLCIEGEPRTVRVLTRCLPTP